MTLVARRWLVFVCMLAALAAVLLYWLPQDSAARSPYGSVPTHPPFEVDAQGRVIPESIPDRVPILDEDGNIVRYNTRAQELRELRAMERAILEPGPPKSLPFDERVPVRP